MIVYSFTLLAPNYPLPVWTDNNGREVLRVNGDNTKQLRAYDAGGNLVAAMDELGRQNTLAYDGLNRVTRQTEPGGAVTNLVYDAAGNLKERQMPGGLTWKATYDNYSRQTGEQLVNGSNSSRQFGFAYYSSGVNQGRLQSVTDPNGQVHSYTYDAFGRVQGGSVAASGSLPGTVTAYTYDARGLVTEVAQTHSGNNAPANTSVQRAYDEYGQIVSEQVLIGGTAVSQVSQTWDAAGRRATLSPSAAPAFNYSYLAGGLLSQVSVNGQSYQYGYDNAGRLNTRTTPWFTQSVTSRDNRGRVLSRQTVSGAMTALTETLTWRGDSTLNSYNAVRGAASETRNYGYNAAGRLTQETFASGTLGYQFDNNTVNGLGVRTRAASGGYEFKATAQDSFARPTGEREIGAVKSFTAHGNALGAATVDVAVDGHNVSAVNFAGADGDGNWSASLALPPGSHTLTATAHHPSGQYSPSAQSQFTVNSGTVAVSTAYNAAGQVTGRTFGDGRTQTLGWDGLGRLVTVSERDSANNGYNWNAVYDAYGRRLRTVWTPVAGNTADNSKTLTTDSIYDPQVEFLEVGVKVNGQQNWKVYGPDQDGVYGGLQGIGGLEASTDADGQTSGILNDYFGNSAAWSSAAGTVTWNDTTVGGYGALPGKVARPLTATTSLADATVWKGKRIDPTGFYYLGARYYEPNSGRFISPDPMGHAASKALYDYANGDPVNNCDPDGRFAKGTVSGWNRAIIADIDELKPEPKSNSFMLGFTIGGHFPELLPGIMEGAKNEVAAVSAGFILAFGGKASYIGVSGITDWAGWTDTQSLTPVQRRQYDTDLNNLSTSVQEALFATKGAVKAYGGATKVTPVPRITPTPTPSTTGKIPSAGGVVRQFEQQVDQIYYRVYSKDKVGGWLTSVPPRSSAWAQEALALPKENKATYIQEVFIPAGTKLERSRALPVPEWGRFRGGGEQFYLLEEILLDNFGPGFPLQ
jgi:RHS repeat-associated protein